jgi:hypothetical protein
MDAQDYIAAYPFAPFSSGRWMKIWWLSVRAGVAAGPFYERTLGLLYINPPSARSLKQLQTGPWFL